MRARRSGGVLRHAGNAAFAACTAASMSASLQNGTRAVTTPVAGLVMSPAARAAGRGRLVIDPQRDIFDVFDFQQVCSFDAPSCLIEFSESFAVRRGHVASLVQSTAKRQLCMSRSLLPIDCQHAHGHPCKHRINLRTLRGPAPQCQTPGFHARFKPCSNCRSRSLRIKSGSGIFTGHTALFALEASAV